jgi:UDP-N-acetylmuramoyl-tripeptide--D-alanyl-D-alanine ligase
MMIREIYTQFFRPGNVSTDSRKIKNGDIFIALKGENFNGDEFAETALKLGACIAVVGNDSKLTPGQSIVKVDDTLQFLQDMARYHREIQNLNIIGLTGTNGKTTTKELIRCVLARKYKVQSTAGNLNNHIGVPLTLLSVNTDTEYTIVEMGANHPGEIKDLCNIAVPKSGLITNIGKAHLEGFGDFEGVKRTKAELYDFIMAGKGRIYLNGSDQVLTKLAGNYYNVLKYNEVNSICQATIIASTPTLSLQISTLTGETETFNTTLYGDYNATNILAAVAIGLDHEMALTEIKQGIETYTPESFRSQVKTLGSTTLILDCYNANPTSMELAVTNFAAMDSEQKMIVLGGMKELGKYEEEEHKKIGRLLQKLRFDTVILYGKEFEKIKVDNSVYFNDFSELENYFRTLKVQNSAILIKGSRSNKLERLEEIIKEHYSSCS